MGPLYNTEVKVCLSKITIRANLRPVCLESGVPGGSPGPVESGTEPEGTGEPMRGPILSDRHDAALLGPGPRTCRASSFSCCWRILSVSCFCFSSCVFRSFFNVPRGTFCFCSEASHLYRECAKEAVGKQAPRRQGPSSSATHTPFIRATTSEFPSSRD